MINKCSNCQKEFFVYICRIKLGRGKYCSKKCSIKAQKGIKLPHLKKYQFKKGVHSSKNTEFKKGNIPVTKNLQQCFCLSCGQEFFSALSIVKKGHGKYCSRKCFGKGKSLELQGEKNYFYGRHHSEETKKKISMSIQRITDKEWKGFLTSKTRLERERFRRTIQKQVFERDNYTCQMCDRRGGILHVDHIQPWSKCIEKRFEMENCRTLCRKCHYFITYGKIISQTSGWGESLPL